MSRSKYEQIFDGRWFKLDSKWDLACCDCGLVHEVSVRLRNGNVEMRMDRLPKQTGGRRRALRKEREASE